MATSGPRNADVVLAGIAIPLVLGGVVSVLTAIGPALALSAGALPGALGVGYALFYAPPGR